jgi:hypothetical protein
MNDQQTISLNGDDTIVIGGRVIQDVGDGDVAELAFPNEFMAVKTGKNGNSIYSFNSTGEQCDLKLRVLRGSDDDRFLNSEVLALRSDPPSYQVLDAQLVKRIGDGSGNVSNDTYVLGGGVPTRNVGAVENVEGSTDQAISIYEFKFTNSKRAIL